MADEEKKGSPLTDFWLVVLGLVALLVLWYANGGPSRADLRGVFLNPPPPVGTGEAYGPQVGSPASTTQYQSDYQSNTSY